MLSPHTASAYLIMLYVLTPSGEMLEDSGTICFELELALEMAAADLASGEGVGVTVYALDAQGQLLNDTPVFSSPAVRVAHHPLPVAPQGPGRGISLWGNTPSTFM